MCRKIVAASWTWVSEWAQAVTGVVHAKNLYNSILNHYIHVLLIKRDSMLYNMLYIYARCLRQ
jgi:hypothetical protein